MSFASGTASPFLTTAQAAAYLRLKPCTLERWRSDGGGPAFHKLGGRAYYKLADLDAYVEARRRRSTAEHRVKAREEKSASSRAFPTPSQTPGSRT